MTATLQEQIVAKVHEIASQLRTDNDAMLDRAHDHAIDTFESVLISELAAIPLPAPVGGEEELIGGARTTRNYAEVIRHKMAKDPELAARIHEEMDVARQQQIDYLAAEGERLATSVAALEQERDRLREACESLEWRFTRVRGLFYSSDYDGIALNRSQCGLWLGEIDDTLKAARAALTPAQEKP